MKNRKESAPVQHIYHHHELDQLEAVYRIELLKFRIAQLEDWNKRLLSLTDELRGMVAQEQTQAELARRLKEAGPLVPLSDLLKP